MFRRTIAAAAAVAGLAIPFAAGLTSAGASLPPSISLRASNGQYLADLGNSAQNHPGSAPFQNCNVKTGSAVNAETSFAQIDLGGGEFALAFFNGDGRGLAHNDFLAVDAGRTAYVHSTDVASARFQLIGGQLVADNGQHLVMSFPNAAFGAPSGSPVTIVAC